MKQQVIISTRPGRKLQQQQLATLLASRNTVVIQLANGIRLRGVVIGSDNFMVLLGESADDANPQFVYKHAIAAVTASAPGIELEPDEPCDSPDFVPIYVPRTRVRTRKRA